MKSWLNMVAPKGSLIREFLSFARISPFQPFVCFYRSIFASRALSGSCFPIVCVIYPYGRLSITKARTAQVRMDGKLRCIPYLGAKGTSNVILGGGSTFVLSGDFYVGQGVILKVSDGGKLVIGGRHLSTGSGISAETKILVETSLEIGCDSIISWNCVITDSNWHDIQGVERSRHVSLGENVWISHSVSVLKGAEIPAGCIVAAHAVVTRSNYQASSLIAGNPAVVKRENVSWRR